MKIAKGKIGNALTSTAKDHVVAVANDLYDEKLNKYQSELNDMIGKADCVYDEELGSYQSELNNKIGKADCLYDKELGMYQSEINKQFIEGGGKVDYFDGGIIDISKKL
jgi:hypothetical protein